MIVHWTYWILDFIIIITNLRDTTYRNIQYTQYLKNDRKIHWKQKYVHAYSVDYSKTFDTVKHESLIEMLQNPHINDKDTRLLTTSSRTI